jgi:uncharacterized protein (TIGR02466 family)
MDFVKRNLFVTDFWEFEFPYHKQLKSQILKYLDSHSAQKHLENNKNSDPSLNTYGGEEITVSDKYICSFFEVQLLKFLKKIEEYHIWEKDEWHSFDCWINANILGGFNPPHIHPGQTYSGVYYISIPKNSGFIHFTDPRPTPIYCTPDLKSKDNSNIFANSNPYDCRVFSYEPKEGSVIIFPSWLTHYVDPNKSNSTRLSLAFNIKYGSL